MFDKTALNMSREINKVLGTSKYKLKIVSDCDPENPRTGFDNVGLMAYWHRRNILGDIAPKEDPADWLESLPEGTIVKPVFVYEHGGIILKTEPFTCPWDSGQLGYIVATPEKIKEGWMCTDITEDIKEKVNACLESEINLFNYYLSGDVWGWQMIEVKECDMGCEHEEVIDSCYGFYGDSIESCGIDDGIPEEVAGQLKEAWDKRFDS